MFKIAKFDGKAVRDRETRASQVALVLKNPHAGVAVQEYLWFVYTTTKPFVNQVRT